MRLYEILTESDSGTYRLFHGSDYTDITDFRFDNLRHRTGTPGTLSFTTSIETAKIYGKFVYEVKIVGRFGDYLDPEDVEANFNWRWPERERWLRGYLKNRPNEIEGVLKSAAEKDRKEILNGYYAMWENVSLWEAMGWDGAWCFESESRNLIVRRSAQITLLGKVNA